MKNRIIFFIFFIFSTMLGATSFGEVYICNFDYYENISKNQSNRSVSIIIPDNSISSYQEKFGEFEITVKNNKVIEIHVSEKLRTHSDSINHTGTSKRFFKSYVSGRSGLRIDCQKRSLGYLEVKAISR